MGQMSCQNHLKKTYFADQAWFKATQAMITIGLIGLIVCLILGVLYMLVHSPIVSKNAVIRALVIVAFVTGELRLTLV